MKTTIQLLLCFCLLQWSCNNDDDTNQEIEIDTSNLVNATASIATFSTLATIDLETGNSLAIQNENLVTNAIHENSFIALFPDRIVRSATTDVAGNQIWETNILDITSLDLSSSRSTMIIHNGIIYLNFKVQNPDFPTPFLLLAIDANTGDLLWTHSQPDYEFRRISVLNNRIITSENFGNQVRITSRDISNGTIMNEWQLDERVSHLISGTNEVIVMSWSDAVYSLDENLNLNWVFPTEGSNVRRGAIVGNQFLFHSRDENIYALNLQFGDLNWSQNFPDLFILDFFTDSNTIWSTTIDFPNNTILINELDINNGTIFSNFTTPASSDISEIEFLNFDDYLLIITDLNTGATRSQLLNFKTQNFIWENEIAIDNISILNANVLVENNRYVLSSFF